MTAHEVARALLAGPDVRVGVAGHGAICFATRAHSEAGAPVAVIYVEAPPAAPEFALVAQEA